MPAGLSEKEDASRHGGKSTGPIAAPADHGRASFALSAINKSTQESIVLVEELRLNYLFFFGVAIADIPRVRGISPRDLGRNQLQVGT